MTRRRAALVGFGCVVAIAAAAAVLSVQRERKAASVKADALAQADRLRAARDLGPSPTARDAKAWLERNGFYVAAYGENVCGELTTITPEGRQVFDTVTGYRPVPAPPLRPVVWVEVEFLFRPTADQYAPGDFLRVEAYGDVTPTRAWREEFAGRPAPRRPE